MQELKVQSSNIKCNGCVNNIKNGLAEIEGVNTIDVDIESNVVTVTGESLKKDVITSRLDQLGYPEA